MRASDRLANRTYSTRLPLGSERLQPLCVAELDEDLDSPLVKVIVLSDVDLTRTADTCVLRKDGQRCTGNQRREGARTVKGIRELLADLADKVSESRFPLVLRDNQLSSTETKQDTYSDSLDIGLSLAEPVFLALNLAGEGRDLSGYRVSLCSAGNSKTTKIAPPSAAARIEQLLRGF